MSTDALIAARMGSSRFKGKTLADLCGKPMLERMVERVRCSKTIDRIVLATTELAVDDKLEEWAKRSNVLCYRGSSDDVLGRLRDAVNQFNMEVVVEMLGDNPLVHSSLIDAAVTHYKENDVDYVATVTNEYPYAESNLKRFPVGVRVQVFGVETIRRCEKLATTPENREHATSFIANHPEIFRTAYVEATGMFQKLNRPELTFAVNHEQNLDLIHEIFNYCYEKDSNFKIESAIDIFDKSEKLVSLMGEPSS